MCGATNVALRYKLKACCERGFDIPERTVPDCLSTSTSTTPPQSNSIPLHEGSNRFQGCHTTVSCSTMPPEHGLLTAFSLTLRGYKADKGASRNTAIRATTRGVLVRLGYTATATKTFSWGSQSRRRALETATATTTPKPAPKRDTV